jgi:hypothetical protein
MFLARTSRPISVVPREHPHVTDTTHDCAEEGVLLRNDLTMPNFWMYSFRTEKVMMLSDLPLNCALQGSCPLGLLVDSEIVLSTRYGKTMVFIIESTKPYQQRPLINKTLSTETSFQQV